MDWLNATTSMGNEDNYCEDINEADDPLPKRPHNCKSSKITI